MINQPDVVWFQGVVEDRNDPLKLGRCRVRCVGYHTPNKEVLPTEDLPWAHPVTPITSAAMSGIGDTPLGPVEGTWVVGYFRDGSGCQQPVMMGTLGGISKNGPNPAVGFSDPNGNYPKEEYIDQADTNKLARNEEIQDTIIQSKKDNLDEMDTASGMGGTAKEPDNPYNAQYPFNKVTETEKGHILELDDTEGAERIHIYHKSGTFIEVHPDGTVVRKSVGGLYEAVMGDGNIHVKGACNITVEGDASILTKGESTIKSEKKQIIESDGDIDIKAAGSVNIIGGNGASSVTASSTSVVVKGQTINLN
jgi:hypothetical protein